MAAHILITKTGIRRLINTKKGASSAKIKLFQHIDTTVNWEWERWLIFLGEYIPYRPDWIGWLDWGKAIQN